MILLDLFFLGNVCGSVRSGCGGYSAGLQVTVTLSELHDCNCCWWIDVYCECHDLILLDLFSLVPLASMFPAPPNRVRGGRNPRVLPVVGLLVTVALSE